MLRVLFIQTAVMTAAACGWFLVALVRRRYDVADVAWGIGFIAASVTAMAATGAVTDRAVLVIVLVVAWGVRLAAHIGIRNADKGEDPRYRKWREEWGQYAALRAFLQIFLLQQYLVLAVLAPVTYVIVHGGGPFTVLDAVGLCIWGAGFVLEALGDYQLLRFTRDPANKGRIMTSGLWKYSRHPNYFGEVMLWWGMFLIALSVPGAWVTCIGPAAITVLILGVSGIPMLEARYEGNAAFAEYKRRTSAFFPLPPKS